MESKEHFDPLAFKMIPLQFLKVLKIQLWYETFVFLCLSPWFERRKRKSLDYGVRERKSRLTPIHPTKKIDLGVNEFHSI